MEALVKAFGEMAMLSHEAEKAFMHTVVKKEFTGKTLLSEAGKVCNHIYFIEKGIARTFYYRDGKDITYWIAAENEFVGSMASFFLRTPGNKYVETLEDAVLWVFDHQKLEKLYGHSKELEKMGRLFAQYGIGLLEQKFDDSHCLTATQRYQLLVQKHPGILRRVPLGMIASYLGVTQETLSRIRSRK